MVVYLTMLVEHILELQDKAEKVETGEPAVMVEQQMSVTAEMAVSVEPAVTAV